jgi:co-chaperonin GroES (HSP10)
MKIFMQADNILVKRIDGELKTKGGILVPIMPASSEDSARARVVLARVVEAPREHSDYDEPYKKDMIVATYDHLFTPWTRGSEFYVIKFQHVLAVVEDVE